MGILRNAIAGTLLGAVVAGAGCTSSGRAFTEFAARSATASYLEGQLNPHDRGGSLNSYGEMSETERRLRNKHTTFESPFGGFIVGSCNYVRDFDGDGVIEFPEEFVGLKDRFSRDEKVSVWLFLDDLTRDLVYELLDNNGNIVESSNMEGQDFTELNSITGIYNDSSLMGDLPKGQINFLESGDYRATWYSNGKFIAHWDFSVYD